MVGLVFDFLTLKPRNPGIGIFNDQAFSHAAVADGPQCRPSNCFTPDDLESSGVRSKICFPSKRKHQHHTGLIEDVVLCTVGYGSFTNQQHTSFGHQSHYPVGLRAAPAAISKVGKRYVHFWPQKISPRWSSIKQRTAIVTALVWHQSPRPLYSYTLGYQQLHRSVFNTANTIRHLCRLARSNNFIYFWLSWNIPYTFRLPWKQWIFFHPIRLRLIGNGHGRFLPRMIKPGPQYRRWDGFRSAPTPEDW